MVVGWLPLAVYIRQRRVAACRVFDILSPHLRPLHIISPLLSGAVRVEVSLRVSIVSFGVSCYMLIVESTLYPT
jgi:hypothetical protein